MATTTIEERVSYIEGRLDSLATKEDLANLKSDLTWRIVVAQLLGMAAVGGIVTAVSALT